MITVSVDLLDESEIARLALFLDEVVQHRARNARAPNAVTTIPVGTAPAIEIPSQTRSVVAPAVVADISPDSVERQFRDYIARKGAVAARQLLDKYDAQYLKDLPAEKRAAFVAELQS